MNIPKKKIRLYNPQVKIIQPYLRKWLKKSNKTIVEIERIFGNRAPHHWFEKIKFASLPSINDWLKLKEILKFDNTHDKTMTTYKLMTEWEIMQEHKERHKQKGHGFGVIEKTEKDKADSLTGFIEKTQVVNTQNRIRRLTPVECERLQGFPDNWTKYGVDEQNNKIEISDTQRYKCLGNAVTTNVITVIIEKLIKKDEKEEEKG